MRMTLSVRKKKLVRSTAYSCRTNIFIEFHHVIKKKKKKIDTGEE